MEETLKLRTKFEPFRTVLKKYELEKCGKIEYMQRQKILDEILNEIFREYASSRLNSNPSSVIFQGAFIQNIKGNNNTAANGTDGTRGTRGILKKGELNKSIQCFTEVVNFVGETGNFDRQRDSAGQYREAMIKRFRKQVDVS